RCASIPKYRQTFGADVYRRLRQAMRADENFRPRQNFLRSGNPKQRAPIQTLSAGARPPSWHTRQLRNNSRASQARIHRLGEILRELSSTRPVLVSSNKAAPASVG